MINPQLVLLLIVTAGLGCGIFVAFTWPKRQTTLPLYQPEEVKREQVVSKDEAPRKLLLELVRKIAGETSPVVIKTKTINKTDEVVYFDRMKPMPRAYFVNAIIKRDKQVKRFLLFLIPWGTVTRTEFIVRCNAYWSEALESLNETIPKFSRELENLLLSDDEKQHIEGVADLSKFRIDGTLLRVILLVFLMSLPFTLFIDIVFHLVPSQIVNWSP